MVQSESFMEKAIDIQDLTKVYSGGTQALKGITLQVESGDFFALLGPNGAGKTTTISILTSLVRKSSGSVRIFGTSIDENPSLTKTYIGLVPQEFNANIFEKVIDIVIEQAGYYGISRKEAFARAEPILTDLGLWEKKDKTPQQLSGGMKRRLMIARALIHEPRLLLLDEPTAGVDVEMRRGMWEYLRNLNARGTTIILTTHYLEEAQNLCRTVAVINKGSVVLHESMASLLERHGKDSLENIYLSIVNEKTS